MEPLPIGNARTVSQLSFSFSFFIVLTPSLLEACPPNMIILSWICTEGNKKVAGPIENY